MKQTYELWAGRILAGAILYAILHCGFWFILKDQNAIWGDTLGNALAETVVDVVQENLAIRNIDCAKL